MRKQSEILGFNVDIFSLEEALEYIEEFIKESKAAQVVTINPEIIQMARKNADLKHTLNSAELVVPDGAGIKLGFKLVHKLEIEQVPGIEISKKLIEICAKNGYEVGFIGAEESVLQAAVENLTKEFPALKIVFQKNGYFSEKEEDEIIDKLISTPVKVLFVALGVPKQEIFIEKFKEKSKTAVGVGVGGSFDVWAGKVKRAPLFFRKHQCEWLYRVCTQPSRLKRIFPALPLFLFMVIIEWYKNR